MNSLTAKSLEQGRERFNAAFKLARKAGVALDDTAFLDHIHRVVVPIVDAVAERMAERTAGVLDALYTVSLQLFGASLLGPTAKLQAINRVWSELLPALVPQLMRDPQRVAATLSNAGYNIASVPEARFDAWLSDLARIAPQCADVNELLEAGKIAAWRAGMAHYRKGALDAAAKLPAELAAVALESPIEMTQRWQADPWATTVSHAALNIVKQVGAFRGFGGPFIRPPKVWANSGQFFATDGEGVWQLIADRFGCVFIRHDVKPANQAASEQITSDGRVTLGGSRATFAELAAATSCAFDGVTLAVTIPTSHAVHLVARGVADAR